MQTLPTGNYRSIQSLLADDKFDINGLDPDGLDLCRPAIAEVGN
jgi:hypothetical protein